MWQKAANTNLRRAPPTLKQRTITTHLTSFITLLDERIFQQFASRPTQPALDSAQYYISQLSPRWPCDCAQVKMAQEKMTLEDCTRYRSFHQKKTETENRRRRSNPNVGASYSYVSKRNPLSKNQYWQNSAA